MNPAEVEVIATLINENYVDEAIRVATVIESKKRRQ